MRSCNFNGSIGLPRSMGFGCCTPLERTGLGPLEHLGQGSALVQLMIQVLSSFVLFSSCAALEVIHYGWFIYIDLFIYFLVYLSHFCCICSFAALSIFVHTISDLQFVHETSYFSICLHAVSLTFSHNSEALGCSRWSGGVCTIKLNVETQKFFDAMSRKLR